MSTTGRPVRKAYIILIFLALAIGSIYIAVMLSDMRGRPVAAVDDAYILYQYARQISEGFPWQYNAGDPATTGASSLLYPFILAGAFAAGVEGDAIVWPALAVGLLSFAISAILIFRITAAVVALTRMHRPPRFLSLLAAVVFVLTGAQQWAFLNGMETGLFTLFLLLSLDSFLRKKSFANTSWLVLASLVRPEGFFLAIANLVAVHLRDQSNHAEVDRRKSVGLAMFAVALSSMPYLVNYSLTSTFLASGAESKSWFRNVPYEPLSVARNVAGGYLLLLDRYLRGLIASRPWAVAPGALLAALFGWWALLRGRQYSLAFLTAAWIFGGTLISATFITLMWHEGRYQSPLLALMIPIAALGLGQLLDSIGDAYRNYATALLASVVLITSGIGTLRSIETYRRAVHGTTHQQLDVADWLADNLPADARVALHDAGALRFAGQRYSIDMLGLTTSDMAAPWRHGMGAVYEALERISPRPGYFVTLPDFAYLAGTALLDDELYRSATLPFETSGTAGPVLAVYKADWSLADSGNSPRQSNLNELTAGMVLVAQLDVADLENEAAFDAEHWEGIVVPGYPTELKQLRYVSAPDIEVLDGGRLLTGGYRFTISDLDPGPITLAARLHTTAAGTMRVSVNGREAGLWRYPTLPGQWVESAFVIPEEFISGSEAEIRLEYATGYEIGEQPVPLGLYYLWVWQGAPIIEEVRPERLISGRFGQKILLLGYDLAVGPEELPENLSLTLYWTTNAALEEDAKVFLHLYDESGALVAQHDGYPYFGTRPPYNWLPGEIVMDNHELILPDDLPPGLYQLAVGLYDPLTSRRLPVQAQAGNVLDDDRLLLTEITIGTTP